MISSPKANPTKTRRLDKNMYGGMYLEMSGRISLLYLAFQLILISCDGIIPLSAGPNQALD